MQFGRANFGKMGTKKTKNEVSSNISMVLRKLGCGNWRFMVPYCAGFILLAVVELQVLLPCVMWLVCSNTHFIQTST